MANLDSIFEKWLETGELTPSDRQLLEQDAVYAEMLKNSETWQSLSAKYQETPVPQWNREATWFEKTNGDAKSNRFIAWFAPAALACSVLMCSLVIMRAEVSVSDSGFVINFAEQQKQAPTVTYEQLQTLLAEQQTNTAQATYALVKEAIEQGRVERKEDIGALVADLNRVRQQDQALIRLQLNELAQQVEQQPQSSIAKNQLWEN
ncbi:hypothetical protein AN214_01982 [Pseudoalteromonas sp. P1-9]|uniref:hypothetical protein n=1 Tax=Pseudoalteromonas sp. P1-9 TaxID=1710354 RepID=UPI0006D62864|nr:hypothetical protein [Pseudoalteromonas sp. P1-9]KPV95983.1 hypothetical protein AN214_01982 [Pseudoalteromonas sp. P1-9]